MDKVMTRAVGVDTMTLIVYVGIGGILLIGVGAVFVFIFQSGERRRQQCLRPKRLLEIGVEALDEISYQMSRVGGDGRRGGEQKMLEFRRRKHRQEGERRKRKYYR